MGSCTNATAGDPAEDGPGDRPLPGLWRAVLRPEKLVQDVVRVAYPPAGPLSRWVEQVWSLAWSRPVPPTTSALITHPTLHLTVEAGPPGEVRHGHPMPAALVHGVAVQHRFAPRLPAHGWVVGLHLVPGAAADLLGRSADTLTDRVVRWEEVWPGWDLDGVWRADGPAARAEALEAEAVRVVGDRRPGPDGQRARSVERLARTDRTLRSVEDLAARVALSTRQLQRLCRTHLGVTPRWLLRRARVLDAHELLSTTGASVAEVAAELGWFDQAHLTRDYTAVTGIPPARLRQERAGS